MSDFIDTDTRIDTDIDNIPFLPLQEHDPISSEENCIDEIIFIIPSKKLIN